MLLFRHYLGGKAELLKVELGAYKEGSCEAITGRPKGTWKGKGHDPYWKKYPASRAGVVGDVDSRNLRAEVILGNA